MSTREPGDHPYARAYDKAAGKRSERTFVPPFRPSVGSDQDVAEGGSDADDDAAAGDESVDGPRKPRQPREDAGRGFGISRAALVLVALALGLGLLVGRVSVNTDQAPVNQPTATASTPAAVPLGPTSLQETGALCSLQKGPDLVLGVEVRNVTTGPLILQQLRVTLPATGLVQRQVGVGSCGEINVPTLKDFGLSTQGTVWLSTTVRVTAKCPAKLPVSMTVYVSDQTGRVQPIAVKGFANLKAVPWSGCPATRVN